MYTCTMYMYGIHVHACNQASKQVQFKHHTVPVKHKKHIFFFAQLNCVIRSKSSSSASIMSVYGRASIPERPG